MFHDRVGAARVADPLHPQPKHSDSDAAPELRALRERRFITVVSHQLKAPLVAVRQYLDLLQEDAQGRPEVAHTQPWLDRSVVRLEEALAIVDDWLALSRIDAGALIQPDSSTELGVLLEGLTADAREDATASQVLVHLEQPRDPIVVRGDRFSLLAALSHITENAIRYNKNGGSVFIRADLRRLDEAPMAVVEVADTGIGIPEAFIPQLFQEFHRSQSKASRGIPGTGLGLAISARIVKELGGHIEVESVEGQGSSFRVYLPLMD
jgi:two-component system, OmpR family, phosphate regulon sensor histidine kinase PhoR